MDSKANDIFSRLKGRYPQTVAAFSQMEKGEQALKAVMDLEEKWQALNRGEVGQGRFNGCAMLLYYPPCTLRNTFDVVIAGGGLGLVAGAALAQRGLRVLVFDRDRVGAAHREWNISERELASLIRYGIFTQDEIAATIGARYSKGLIQFEAEGTGVTSCPLYLDGVLDVALDAQAVLDMARKRFLSAGGVIKEGRRFQRLHCTQNGPVASVFEVTSNSGVEFYRARMSIDTMGSVSPLALALNGGLPFNGVCPTAGTVTRGLEQDRQVGDVLVSVAPVQGGRQLIWEGFPGHADETTVYLFYYDQTGKELVGKQGLLPLFEQYFAMLPHYKNALSNFEHVRPVFGYIPARFGRAGRTAARGLVCLGDSAAGQSPLTFCGFGSFVRHIGRVTRLIEFALNNALLEERHLESITPHQANLRVAWVFSRFMQPWPGSDPHAINRLMNVFCRALQDLGPDVTVRFLQDRYTFGEYIRIMLTTARHYPAVFPITARALGLTGLVKWAGDIAAFAWDGLGRALFNRVGLKQWRMLERLIGKGSPNLALKLISRRTNWQVTL